MAAVARAVDDDQDPTKRPRASGLAPDDPTLLPKPMNCAPAARQLKIAVVYSRIPFPMMRGDQLTVAHLISFLAARGHAVDLYTLHFGGEMVDRQSEWLRSACRKANIYKHGLPAMLGGAIRALFKGQPLQVGIFHNRRLAGELKAAAAVGEYDILYCYYIRSAPDTPDLRRPGRDRPASVLAMQLSQTLNMRRIYDNQPLGWKKLFYLAEKTLFARYEARAWQKFDRTMLIGPADVAAVKEVGRRERQPEVDNWAYGAHGTDTNKFIAARPEEIRPNRVVMSGSMIYQPNVQAVSWFIRECWPAIRQARPDAELIVQGWNPGPALRKLDGQQGIVVTGTVPDVGEYIRSAAVCINPMLAASGMQNKLIEYMACAKAVVATTVANEGVRAPADALIIADGAEGFAREVIGLLNDPERALAIGQQAREYVLANWTWEEHFLKLEQEFYSLCGGDAPLSAV
jgi:glycosyltransferase involved in cell wall biosynthesis